MRNVRVGLKDRGYDVVVGHGLDKGQFGSYVAGHEKVAVIADVNAYRMHGEGLVKAMKDAGLDDMPVLEVNSGEQSKSWDWAMKGCDFLAESSMGRKDWVIALGGGVVGDLAGFVAAVYMRGIRFMSFPTTLLAQVDASVGGKTAIDIKAGKNLVGVFHQPSLVVADINTLSTLPGREFFAGMAEVVKHGLIDTSVMTMVSNNLDELAKGADADPDLLADLVTANVRCKASVVVEDEREAGVRAHLNLGHTFAHAIEATLGYGTLLHGEAVSMGLVAASNLASRLGLADGGLQKQIEQILSALHLPTRIPSCDANELIGRMYLDKKAEGGNLRFVLLSVPGEVFVEDKVPSEAVLATLDDCMD